METTNKQPNLFEEEIIVILCELECFDIGIDEYRKIEHLTNPELVKFVFNNHIKHDYHCEFSQLHKMTDYVDGVPGISDIFPSKLFQATMQMAVKSVNWCVVAQDSEIAKAIQSLRLLGKDK